MRYAIAAILAAIIAITASHARTTDNHYKRVTTLFSGDRTVVGETVHYPSEGPAKITSVIVTMLPGETTGWHTHGVPLFAYMLEGELQVDYGPKGVRTYKKGDAFLEAMDVRHDGVNKGPTPARVLAVFMGAEGRKNVVRSETTKPPR